jgi:hypothetical protein
LFFSWLAGRFHNFELTQNRKKNPRNGLMDAKEGFWLVKLDEESSLLTTFWTPFGWYRWTRLPFGLSSAPEEFQRKQHEVLPSADRSHYG